MHWLYCKQGEKWTSKHSCKQTKENIFLSNAGSENVWLHDFISLLLGPKHTLKKGPAFINKNHSFSDLPVITVLIPVPNGSVKFIKYRSTWFILPIKYFINSK
jgi:hypothetical protein